MRKILRYIFITYVSTGLSHIDMMRPHTHTFTSSGFIIYLWYKENLIFVHLFFFHSTRWVLYTCLLHWHANCVVGMFFSYKRLLRESSLAVQSVSYLWCSWSNYALLPQVKSYCSDLGIESTIKPQSWTTDWIPCTYAFSCIMWCVLISVGFNWLG